ncbi:MAG: STAS domain-containing protein [Clostridia bacterium]|nr:STAS domain-containing protein [Clostridia bacterium]
MTITRKQNGDNLEIALEGRLDTVTAPELETELKQSLAGIKSLTFDFSKVEYVSSAGLRALFEARKALYGKGSMKITHPNEIVMEVFEVTGFADLVKTE